MAASQLLRRQAANAVTLLALLPLPLVMHPQGSAWLPAALLFADFIDSLDGLVARALNTSTSFGAQLDRTCDSMIHGGLVVAVAAQLPAAWWLCCFPPLIAIAIVCGADEDP